MDGAPGGTAGAGARARSRSGADKLTPAGSSLPQPRFGPQTKGDRPYRRGCRGRSAVGAGANAGPRPGESPAAWMREGLETSSHGAEARLGPSSSSPAASGRLPAPAGGESAASSPDTCPQPPGPEGLRLRRAGW